MTPAPIVNVAPAKAWVVDQRLATSVAETTGSTVGVSTGGTPPNYRSATPGPLRLAWPVSGANADGRLASPITSP